jgi:hypothetical protein
MARNAVNARKAAVKAKKKQTSIESSNPTVVPAPSCTLSPIAEVESGQEIDDSIEQESFQNEMKVQQKETIVAPTLAATRSRRTVKPCDTASTPLAVTPAPP